jgi:antitoxin (DNA-binding transcriptional repressor) of toxin-antitoxin stability system
MHRVAAGEELLVTYRGRSHIRLTPAAPALRSAAVAGTAGGAGQPLRHVGHQ